MNFRQKKQRAYRPSFVAAGRAPGTLEPIPGSAETKVRVMAIGADDLVETEIPTADGDAMTREIEKYRGAFETVWIDVTGLANVDAIKTIGRCFGLHPLALEDVLNVDQRAKTEGFPEHLFVIAHMLSGADLGVSGQVSFFFGQGWLVTFQERPATRFEPVRVRIREGRERMRTGGSSYLTYALLDAIVDGYFPLIEALGEWLEELETSVLDDPRPETLRRVHRAKRRLMVTRRAIWALRDAIGALLRDDSGLVAATTTAFLRDCHDHAVRLMELTENQREVASGLIDLYMSSVSNRMNEVMKVLTIIATIFIPLGFVAGLYGMNFRSEASPWNMPELDWAFGYPMALGLMVAIAGGMLLYFRRRRWL